MLESLQTEAKGNRTLYMIGASTTGEKIKLGRGHQCEIRITDISVSREHAHIKYENDRFLVLDNNSKFGTLIKLQKDLQIKVEKVAVQIGRTVVTCAIKFDEVPISNKDKSQKNLSVNSSMQHIKK
jgi:pSer/pThr/pTyr-binding forkhead associated (FHA) protein